ncbi:hypothetical protein K461DRAFT_276827 [Myriangium duriaei CBS 260.36]|uniref:Uncharacterized protein n=1 Tax=Myriangium duriaei CBS 260.36 TaxID=1168546 RepID=A0A9P4MI11_9PEZI|nr:hypothetical protein K461DRAFT_276827 [Myriangium duriaei CBS 260.36]
MSVGTFLRTITKTRPLPPKTIHIPPPIIVPGLGPNIDHEVPRLGAPGDPGGAGNPGGLPDPEPVPIGGEDEPPPEIDWDKIFDPGPDPLLPDPAEEWSYLFQGWCVHSGHLLVQLGRKATGKQLVKYQGSWLAYVITTFPRYTLSLKRLLHYLEEWKDLFGVISFELKTPEAIPAIDVKDFGDSQMLLDKLIAQLKGFSNCKWTGFMTGQVAANPAIGQGGNHNNSKGGLKGYPSSHGRSGGDNNSDQSGDDDEDFNPGDAADNRPDQEQSRQRQWELLFLAWRTDLINFLYAIRNDTNRAQIDLLVPQLRTGPAVGSNRAQINAELTVWDLTLQLIRQQTDFNLLPVANLDHRLNTIVGNELLNLRNRLTHLVTLFPNYQWHGDPQG